MSLSADSDDEHYEEDSESDDYDSEMEELIKQRNCMEWCCDGALTFLVRNAAGSDDEDDDSDSSEPEFDKWGKKKQIYHQHQDHEYEDEFEEEETEVLRLQKKTASARTEDDYDDTFGTLLSKKSGTKSVLDKKETEMLTSAKSKLVEYALLSSPFLTIKFISQISKESI